MNRSRPVRIYQALLVFYPRRFRREYGEDMVLLFAEQLRDESAWRVCSRATTDFALTVPTRHLEVIMKKSTSPFLSTFFGAVAVAGAMFAVVSGTSAALAIVGAVTAVLAGGLSLLSYRRNRPLVRSSTEGGWWKPLAAGGGLLTALIVTVNLTGEVSEDLWLPMVITGLTAALLIALGLILGVSHLATHGSRRADAG